MTSLSNYLIDDTSTSLDGNIAHSPVPITLHAPVIIGFITIGKTRMDQTGGAPNHIIEPAARIKAVISSVIIVVGFGTQVKGLKSFGQVIDGGTDRRGNNDIGPVNRIKAIIGSVVIIVGDIADIYLPVAGGHGIDPGANRTGNNRISPGAITIIHTPVIIIIAAPVFKRAVSNRRFGQNPAVTGAPVITFGVVTGTGMR
jgi:hypothetical protein